jgi:carbonic anhydrase/acetyltransferase-like protein (isoleucine patch superfamily)
MMLLMIAAICMAMTGVIVCEGAIIREGAVVERGCVVGRGCVVFGVNVIGWVKMEIIILPQRQPAVVMVVDHIRHIRLRMMQITQ